MPSLIEQSKKKPNPNVDYDYIKYNQASDYIRPGPGYRVCKKCHKVKAINQWNFSIKRRNPDGFSYICKECDKAYRQKKKAGS